MRIRLLKIILVIVLLLGLVPKGKASHIFGGEITYVCLGAYQYKITVTIFRDCLSGIVGAIREDDPAYISVFQTNGNFVFTDSIYGKNSNGEVIPPTNNSDCIVNAPRTCMNKIVFEKTYVLNNSSTGYKVVYQRCCRNASILNIFDPSSSGATYSCVIPPESSASCNNSAQYKNYPPQIICVNNPFVYDHSATDADGDSLSYEFCQAYDGGSNNNPKPKPTFYSDPLIYTSSYSYSRPMGGNPRIQINPKTGMISGTPNIQGRFVVAVCCHEWRGGVIINTVTREFQFVVTSCSKSVVANIPQYSTEFNTYIVNCKNNSVYFVNTSTGGKTYYWDFGVKGMTTDTSTQFEPTFNYPDSGLYVVTLYVNKETPCKDSITRFVKVYPKLKADFYLLNIACPGDTVQFTDNTLSSYGITSWQWNFDDFSPIDFKQNTKHVYNYGGLYNPGLIVANKQGCLDTIFRKILIDPFRPSIGKDTTIVVGESINFNCVGGTNYIWTPAIYLSNPSISNPIGHFTDIGTFKYIINAKSPQTSCRSKDSITVRVIGNSVNTMPNAFTPNGDGKNDIFRPILVGYQSLRYFRVFNRYGQMMFSTENIEDGWDGTFNGKQQELGVYYWMMGVKDRFGKDFDEKGDVTLIR